MSAHQTGLLYLARADVEALALSTADVLAAVEESFRRKGLGEVQLPPKIGVDAGRGAFAHAMPAFVPAAGALGVKWVAVFPDNPAGGLPTTTGVIVLDDPATGLPMAIIEAGLVTALRTGASAGVAARYLARPDAETAAIVGCGVQGRSSLRALAAALPGLRRVRCRDALDAAARAFVDEMAAALPGLEFTLCPSAPDAVREADVAVTAIPMDGQAPPLDAGDLPEGALAVALDYDAAWTPAAMAACDRVVCDDLGQTLATSAAGVHLTEIPPLDTDLGLIVAGRAEGRTDPRQRILCLNLGIATHDMLTARLVYDRARAAGLGTELRL
ncbi:MAG TPA: ornithine cyclodeaminase family protein [Thermoleophilia bacterium]|nr:ornithine cyclodeaminase family protein [Thermoleophilia bacterium]